MMNPLSWARNLSEIGRPVLNKIDSVDQLNREIEAAEKRIRALKKERLTRIRETFLVITSMWTAEEIETVKRKK